MNGNIHWLCGKEDVLQTLQKEVFTGYARTKIFTTFDNKLVMRSSPVVMYLSMRSYHMLYWLSCGTSLILQQNKSVRMRSA